MIITDQINRQLVLEHQPCRIVSLVPSLTELLYYFGLDDEVVGITKFCVHPREWLQKKTRIGGTKQMHLETIQSLLPDLIITNKEENTKDMVEQLEQICPVFVTDINTIEESFQAISALGEILNKQNEALQLIEKVNTQFDNFQHSESYSFLKDKRFLYFIWLNPDRVAGTVTYINDVFLKLGLKNNCLEKRYPEIDHRDQKIDYIFLSSEPYPFKEKNIPYFVEKYPNSQIILVDGEIFSWYGSRMENIVPYMYELRKRME